MPASTVTTVDAASLPDSSIVETGDVTGFEIVSIAIDGTRRLVARADTGELRQRGLMFVEDLGDLDGMLFEFEAERSGGFWMKNTLIPLDIAFFDSSGILIGTMTMEPCDEDPCPTYDIGEPYRYALETPAGALSGLGEDAKLEISIDTPESRG